MPFSFTLEQKQTAFWLARWLAFVATAILTHALNPLAVIFALLAFGQLFDFVGVLLVLPASAILLLAFKHLRRHYLLSSFYNA